MTTALTRLGRFCAARPRRVLGAWVVVLALAWIVATAFGTPGQDDYDIPGTDSLAATEFLRQEFPGMAGDEARVVLHSDRALSEAAVVATTEDVADLPHVGSVASRWSDDRATVLVSVQYTVPVTAFDGTEALDALDDATAEIAADGVQVEYGGLIAENAMPAGSSAELVGMGVALVVLLLAFGSVLAAGLPLLVALFGLGVGTALVTSVGSLIDVSASAPMVATMVGIGVGIDYALLLVSRYLDHVRAGDAPVDAAALATGSAGTSIVYAGAAVLVSVSGLALGGLPVFTSFGYATGLVVLSVVAVSVTLVPALCAWSGTRMIPRRRHRRPTSTRTPLTARWAAVVGRRPVAFALLGVTVLLTLAAPTLTMRTWPQDAGTQDESRTTRQAYDLLEDAFGPEARARWTPTEPVKRDYLWLFNAPLRMLNAMRLDDRESAAALHAELVPWRGHFGGVAAGTASLGPVDLYLGIVGRHLGLPDADEDLRHAIELAERHGSTHWAGQARTVLDA